MGAAIPLNTFCHTVATFEGTVLRLYIDGTLADPANVTLSLPDTSADLVLGAASYSQDGYDGSLDEVAISGKPLSAERVQAHFEAGR